jgi:AraC family transcriptional regulator
LLPSTRSIGKRRKPHNTIEAHLSEEISLATLADVARLIPYHFVPAFKQSFGLPPHRYLSSLRMQRPKALLANPAMSVTQIGFNLGFSETSSSMTAFRKHIGLTPTAYRRGLG